MNKTVEKNTWKKNLTIPNALSVFRIVLIPFLIFFFLQKEYVISIVLWGLSGLSDAFDGIIARKFNQVTELGKMLDPIADKLTQGAVAACFAIIFPHIFPLLCVLIAKEVLMLIGGLVILACGKRPVAAQWYGKVSTTLFYLSMALIVVLDGFVKAPAPVVETVSTVALVITVGFMLYTFVQYFFVFRKILQDKTGMYALHPKTAEQEDQA